MTMLLTNGKTFSRQRNDEKANVLYQTKILTNTSKTLNRLGSVAVVEVPKRPKSGQNRMKLFVRGVEDETKRIAKVLDVTVEQINAGSTLPIKFGRITVMVNFRQDPAKVNDAHNRRSKVA